MPPAAAASASPAAPSPHRHRLYAAALEQARDMEVADGARWLIRHGLLSLTDHPQLPASLRPPLVVATQRNAAANLLRVARFQAVADALAGLPLCPLKGIHLLATVYRRQPEHRVLTDLDLLVFESDAEEALDRLETLGFRETAASRAAAAHRHERVLTDGSLAIELHTRLGINHGPRSAWEELAPRRGEVHGRACHLLDAETTLVHLVTHFVRHGPYTRLGWVEDLVRWCEPEPEPEPGHAPPDAAGALAVARRLGAERTFVAGVRALSALLGGDFLPAVPRREGGDRLLALHERLVWSHLARHPLLCGFASNAVRRNLSAVLLADRPGDAATFVAAKGRELWSRWAPGGPGTKPPDASPTG